MGINAVIIRFFPVLEKVLLPAMNAICAVRLIKIVDLLVLVVKFIRAKTKADELCMGIVIWKNIYIHNLSARIRTYMATFFS